MSMPSRRRVRGADRAKRRRHIAQNKVGRSIEVHGSRSAPDPLPDPLPRERENNMQMANTPTPPEAAAHRIRDALGGEAGEGKKPIDGARPPKSAACSPSPPWGCGCA